MGVRPTRMAQGRCVTTHKSQQTERAGGGFGVGGGVPYVYWSWNRLKGVRGTELRFFIHAFKLRLLHICAALQWCKAGGRSGYSGSRLLRTTACNGQCVII